VFVDIIANIVLSLIADSQSAGTRQSFGELPGTSRKNGALPALIT
jgi:hypothetical protein